MVKTYRKGYRGELELVHMLSKKGWLVFRSPRSGRITLPCPDIIAVKKGKILAIECKVRRDAFSIPIEQLDQLKQWEDKGGASVFIAWKIPHFKWLFLKLNDVIENNGNLSKRFALEKGVEFEKMLKSIDG